MSTRNDMQANTQLQILCNLVKALAAKMDYDSCIQEIRIAMEQYPHAPQPHNLMGIILEKQGEHSMAMKHFRAAWALDPTYLPTRHNLHTYGTFYATGKCAFDDSDLLSEAQIK